MLIPARKPRKNSSGDELVIRTTHGNRKRGTLTKSTKVFRRDDTPVWNDFIFIEPDVLAQLIELSCVEMRFILRDKREVSITLVEFIEGHQNLHIGGRSQKGYYIAHYFEVG